MYSFYQWLILFYVYCFIGWVWESCYVSIKEHKWINRGFLRGPFLPIYGSGAIVVLLLTFKISKSFILVFIIGMILSTMLEYITGAIMENLFNVKYWDYSNNILNLNGHICLISSLAWGFFSLLLVRFVNPRITELIFIIPSGIGEIIVYIITIFITIDSVQSFNQAIDLKNILVKITDRNQVILNIKKHLESFDKIISNDVREFQELLAERLVFNKEVKLSKKELRKKYIYKKIKDNLLSSEQKIKKLSEKLSMCIEKVDNESNIKQEDKIKLKNEIINYLLRLKSYESYINFMENKIYINAINMLLRNPNAKAKDYEEAIKELKGLSDNLKEK